MVWEDERNALDNESDIYFNSSIDCGENWQSSDIRLNTDTIGIYHLSSPSITCDDNNVYVAWQDDRNGVKRQLELRFPRRLELRSPG